MMNITRIKTIGLSAAACLVLLVATDVKADIVDIGYSVGGTSWQRPGGLDFVQLLPNSNASVPVPENGSAVAKLNDVNWLLTQIAWEGSGSLSRTIGIALAAGDKTLSQDMTVDVNYGWLGENQFLTIGASAPVHFQWTDASNNYDLTITAQALTLQHAIGYLDPNGEMVTGAINGDFSLTATPVPEPTTILAGALLLLPFGVSTIRMLRRKTTA
jgi:hypothetical protein